MLDLVGLLTTPHLYIGALVGFLASLGTAWLVQWAFPFSAQTSLLALIVAVGCVAGLAVAARLDSGDRK
jgi:hypothetical protein